MPRMTTVSISSMVVCMSGHDVRASASLRLVTQSYRHRVSKDSTEGYSLSPADLYVIGLRLRPQLGERLDPTRNHSRLGPHIVLLELDDEVPDITNSDKRFLFQITWTSLRLRGHKHI